GVAALEVVAARVPPASPGRARALPVTCVASRPELQRRGAAVLARKDGHAPPRARRLRPLWRALDARVCGRADRHRDAARDDRLRPGLGRAAAVRGARGLVAPPLRALRQLRPGDDRELALARGPGRSPLPPAPAWERPHLAHNHIWKSIGWYALFAFPLAYVLSLAARRRGGMGLPEAVPLVIFVYVVLQLAVLPLRNVVTRHLEAEADWSALRATRDPVA